MNRNFFLIAIVIIALDISSQEFDEDYLSSLPKDVRNDVLEKMEAEEKAKEPVYRRASSYVDKESEIPSNDTVLFGFSFFDQMQTSFMPTNEPNLDSSYILDFGDILEIQLIGQQDSIDSYLIERDGSINLPDIGKLILSGLSMNDASSLIKAKVSNTYIGTQAFISLKNIRDITVLIAGNAFNPGIYTLNGNSNMLHALNMAGGISDVGSYREIILKRNGKIIDILDLYDVLINGNYNFTSSLRSGDSIVVSPIKSIVAVESGVIRPALFEVKETETFSDILRFANGFSNNADKNNIILKRIINGKSEIINLDIDSISSVDFLHNDSIFIREFKITSVVIEGAVKNPGTYNLAQGAKLSDLIKSAGGYEKSAYPFGGFLENQRALNINLESKERLYETFIDNLISNQNMVSADESGAGLLLQQIRDSKVSGRVIAEFDLDLLKNNSNLDTVLEDGDRVYIPNLTQQVYVQGKVSNPGAVRYVPGKEIEYYVEGSGGLLKSSDSKNIFVVHPNGQTINLSANSRLSFLVQNNTDQLIYPGSIIYVPQTTEFTNSLQVASIWAPIISSIALSLTSLSVLDSNN